MLAAMELFAKEGSRGTSLAAIAERVGVTKPAITHHFGTKAALLVEIVDELDRADAERLGDVVGLDGVRRWASELEADPAFAALSRLRAVIVSEALDVDHPAHEPMVERHRRQRRHVVEVLGTGQHAGTIRPDVDAHATATEILAFCQGIQFQWLLDPDDVAIAAVVDAYFARLASELSPG